MEERTCTVDGCAKKTLKRDRFCSMHRARLRRHGDVRGVRGECEICGDEFWKVRADQKACGATKCRKGLWRKAETRRILCRPECAVEDCAKTAISRGFCEAHYAKWLRYGDPLGLRRECVVCGSPFYLFRGQALSCPTRACRREITRRAGDKRRALKKGAFVERVFRLKVYERDGWRCHLCHRAVRRDAEWPHPLSPSLDHVIPIACGGTHEYTNVRCAHLRCNTAKNIRPMDEQLLLC